MSMDIDDADMGEPPGGWQPTDDVGPAPGTSAGGLGARPTTTAMAATTNNRFSPEVVRAIEGVKFIAEHLKKEDEARYVSNRVLHRPRGPMGSIDIYVV